jgi:hypothetical protein
MVVRRVTNDRDGRDATRKPKGQRLTGRHVDDETNTNRDTTTTTLAHNIHIPMIHRSWLLPCDCHLVMVCCVVSRSVWSVCSHAAPTLHR